MTTATIHDAKTHFSQYLREVESGKEIIIKRRNTPVARLLPYDVEEKKEEILESIQKKNNVLHDREIIALAKKRGYGKYEGKIWISDDFNDSMEDLFDVYK